ncbi:MAG: hypothetical protein HQL11_04000, partial [Candidatus Omnitrophica bacterium]|nr:hypothetical protein [Candidatus Omnitrophota bacterium]
SGDDVTRDGGAFWGRTIGLWADGAMDGVVYALYMAGDGSGDAGYLVGSISGGYYENLELWSVEGDLYPDRIATLDDLTAVEFVESIHGDGDDELSVTGGFEGAGTIDGQTQYARYMSCDPQDMWGILHLKFGGSNTYWNPYTGTTWSAKVSNYDSRGRHATLYSLDGSWQDGQIRGSVTGRELSEYRLSHIEGDLYGAYTDSGEGDGTWVATALSKSWDEYLTLNGVVGEGDGSEGGLYANGSGSANHVHTPFGLIGAVDTTWDGPMDYFVIGKFNSVGPPENLLLHTSFRSSDSEGGTTPDGGAYWGISMGLWKGEEIRSRSLSFYVDPDGAFGYLDGSFGGSYDTDNTMWEGDGTLTPTELLAESGLTAGNLQSSVEMESEMGFLLSGDFAGLGDIWASGTGRTWRVEDGEDGHLPYGILEFAVGFDEGEYGGYEEKPLETSSWTASFGGSVDNYDRNYFLADITGGKWEDGELSGLLSGFRMTETEMRDFEGNLTGVADAWSSDGGWIATALARETITPLSFSGYAGWEAETFYVNDEGYFGQVADDFGLIGAVDSPWNAPTEVRGIGEYSLYENPSSAYLWITRVESHNAIEGDATTLDGGAFLGYTVGLLHDGTIEGTVLAHYQDPSSNFGYLEAGITGDYYEHPDMWSFGGIWGAHALGTVIESNASDFNNELNFDGFDENGRTFFAGHFANGEGWMEAGDPDGVEIYNGVARDDLWHMGVAEYGNGNAYSNPEHSDTWTGFGASDDESYVQLLPIEGTWEDGLILGSGTGTAIDFEEGYILSLTADFYGLYNDAVESEDWIGAMIYQAALSPIGFSGIWGDVEFGEDNGLYRFFDGEMDFVGSSGTGLMAAVNAPWDEGPSSVTAIGSYEAEADAPYLWLAPVESYDYSEEASVTADGAFRGWAAGVWTDGGVRGFFNALYLDPDGNAGILTADIDGGYYPAPQMWSVTGALDSAYKENLGEFSVWNFVEDCWPDYQSMEGQFGSFADGGALSGTIEQCSLEIDTDGNIGWGIWVNLIGGQYLQSESESWSLPFSGYGSSGEESDGPFLAGIIRGDRWSDGRLDGNVDAVWLSDPSVEWEGEGRSLKIQVGTAQGPVTGDYQIEGEEWSAVGAGEWVEVAELFDVNDLAELTQELVNAGNLVNLPITEMYNLIDMTGSGNFAAGGILQATMDLNLYGVNGPGSMEGIWAALLEGSFMGATSNDWALNFGGENDTVQFTGTSWSDNQWMADVIGQVDGKSIQGVAEGQYQELESGSGVFSGAATGNWENGIAVANRDDAPV